MPAEVARVQRRPPRARGAATRSAPSSSSPTVGAVVGTPLDHGCFERPRRHVVDVVVLEDEALPRGPRGRGWSSRELGGQPPGARLETNGRDHEGTPGGAAARPGPGRTRGGGRARARTRCTGRTARVVADEEGGRPPSRAATPSGRTGARRPAAAEVAAEQRDQLLSGGAVRCTTGTVRSTPTRPPASNAGRGGGLPARGHVRHEGVPAAVGRLGDDSGAVVAVPAHAVPGEVRRPARSSATASASTRVVVTRLSRRCAPSLRVRVAASGSPRR